MVGIENAREETRIFTGGACVFPEFLFLSRGPNSLVRFISLAVIKGRPNYLSLGVHKLLISVSRAAEDINNVQSKRNCASVQFITICL
jgi:hypothetical protein